MTSSFLPSDLSGILPCSSPPSPPPLSLLLLHTHTYTRSPTIQPSHSLCSSFNPHPATVSLTIFLSHLAYPSTTPPPVLPATLPLSPKGIIHYEVEHSFKVKCQWLWYWKLCWVAPTVAIVAALFLQLHWSHLIPKPMRPWPPQLQASWSAGNQ